MDDLGIAEPSRGRIIRLTYELLGLFSFFTAGDDECRAWTLRRGATAVDAAGTIHSDLARGFIRAQVIGVDELIEAGSMAEARNRGILRQEGQVSTSCADGEVHRGPVQRGPMSEQKIGCWPASSTTRTTRADGRCRSLRSAAQALQH